MTSRTIRISAAHRSLPVPTIRTVCRMSRKNRRILFSTLLNIDYHTPVNHEGIYAQAYALYRQGFQYWYENEEITFLNNRNEAFRQKDPIEGESFLLFPGSQTE